MQIMPFSVSWQIARPFFPLVVYLAVMLGIAVVPATAAPIANEDLSEPPFAPTWQLMNRVDKQHFIAGYLHAMKDAATMTRILSDFIRDNPKGAEEGLERLRGLYSDLAQGKPPDVAEGIDRFFKDPDNRQAPLSRAITGARAAQ